MMQRRAVHSDGGWQHLTLALVPKFRTASSANTIDRIEEFAHGVTHRHGELRVQALDVRVRDGRVPMASFERCA